jgi:hypothetical protein
MAPPRPSLARAGKTSPLLFKAASTLAWLILLATGVFVLSENFGGGSDLGSFIAVMFGVFGLYGAVLGILQIRDMLRQSAPRTSAH